MKIVYVVEPRGVIGGGVRAAMNLVKAMQRYYKAEASIFGTYKGAVKDEDVTFHEVDTLKPMSAAYWGSVKEFLKGQHPDIVHCLGLFSALLLVMQKQMYGFDYKIVCTVHRVTMNMRFRSILKIVLPYISKHIDYATFLTPYQQNHYFNNVGYRPKKYIIVPNVIFVEKYNEAEISAKREELEKKVGTDMLTCYVGRIIPSKNIEDTIRLVGILNRRGLPLGCILVGGYEQEYYEKLQRIIKEENVADKVSFEGYVNNPVLFNAATDTTTTTTQGEALPNLMVESFALGKVVFSSDIPQMTGLIDNGRNGFTCSLTDLEAMADVMERVYKDKQYREKIGQAALKTYEDTYNPHSVASKYYEIYEKCCKS